MHWMYGVAILIMALLKRCRETASTDLPPYLFFVIHPRIYLRPSSGSFFARDLCRLNQLVAVGHFNAGRFHHNRCRAVLFGREFHCALHLAHSQVVAGNNKAQVDLLSTAGTASTRSASISARQSVTCWRLFFSMLITSKRHSHQTQQQHFHRPDTHISTTLAFGAIHHCGMTASGLTEKHSTSTHLTIAFIIYSSEQAPRLP